MKRLVAIVLLLLVWAGAESQYVRQDTTGLGHKVTPPSSFEDHISIGGDVGLQFGSITIIGLAPLINYHFPNNLIIGVGPIYQYYNFQEVGFLPYTASIYGGRVTAMQFLPGKLSNIFLMGEYDLDNVPDPYAYGGYETRATIGIPLLGLGYKQPIGSRAYFMVAGLWDLSGSILSPYSNPVILTGFDFGL